MADDHAMARSADRKPRDPVINPDRYPFFDKLLFAVFILAVPVFIAGNADVFRDGDVSWHIAAGRWILEHGRVPSTDSFSFTMFGKPWVAFEWGSEIIYSLAYSMAGVSGLAVVVTAALTALFAIIFAFLRDKAGPIAILVLFVTLFITLQPFILARPHTLAWPFLAGWSALLLYYRDRKEVPPLWLAMVMFAWANIHGSYFAGFIVAAAISLDAVTAARWDRKVILRWFIFGMVSLAATLVNANGLAGFLHPISISSMETLPVIGEWQPSSPRPTPVFFLALLATLGVLLWKRPRFQLGELLLLLLTLGMAFQHMRHQSVFLILAALIVTPKLSRRGELPAAPLFATGKEKALWIAAAAAVLAVVFATRLAVPLRPDEALGNPRTLIAHVPPELRSKPVFNSYSMGGPLILSGVRVFIDGRADMYGDEHVKEYMKIEDGDAVAFQRAVRKYGICWTMLGKDSKLAALLDASPDWKRSFTDKIGMIHVRPACLAGAATPGTDRR